MDKGQRKERILKRNKEGLENDLYPLDDDWKEKYNKYIFGDENPDYVDEENWQQEYRRINRLLNDGFERYNYLSRLKKNYRTKWAIPKWVQRLLPKPDERRNKVSKLFWDVGAELWGARVTRKEARKISEQLRIYPDDRLPPAFCIVNVKKIANKFQTTPANVWIQINRWCDDENGAPYIKMGMTDEKKKGGKTIIALGRWSKKTQHKFFKEEKSKEWIRGILFRKRS